MNSSCVQNGTKIAVLLVVSTLSIPVSLQPIGADAISPCSCKYCKHRRLQFACWIIPDTLCVMFSSSLFVFP